MANGASDAFLNPPKGAPVRDWEAEYNRELPETILRLSAQAEGIVASKERELTDQEIRILKLKKAMDAWKDSQKEDVRKLAERPLLDHIAYALGIDRECRAFSEYVTPLDNGTQRQAICAELGEALAGIAAKDNYAAEKIVGLLAPEHYRAAQDASGAASRKYAGKNQAKLAQDRLNRLVGDALTSHVGVNL